MAALAEAQFRILRELAGGDRILCSAGGHTVERMERAGLIRRQPHRPREARRPPGTGLPRARPTPPHPRPRPVRRPPAASSFTPSPGRGPPASPAPPRPGAQAPRPGVRPVRTLTRAGTPLPGLGPGAFVRIPGCTPPPPPAATVPRGAHPPDPAILPSLSNQARPRSPYSPEFDPHAPRRPAAHRPRPTGAANTPHQPGCTPPPPPTSTRRVRSAQYFHAYP